MTKSTASSTPNRNPSDPNRLAQNLSKIIEQSQRILQEYLRQQERGDQISFIDPNIIGKSFQELFQRLLKDPDKLIAAQVEFWKNTLDLWQAASERMAGRKAQAVIEELAFKTDFVFVLFFRADVGIAP